MTGDDLSESACFNVPETSCPETGDTVPRWLIAVLILLAAAVVYMTSSWAGWLNDLWTTAVAASAFMAGRASRG